MATGIRLVDVHDISFEALKVLHNCIQEFVAIPENGERVAHEGISLPRDAL